MATPACYGNDMGPPYMLDELRGQPRQHFDQWNDAKAFLTKLKGEYVFRGMSSADWNLETSLERATEYGDTESERLLYDSFRSASAELIENCPPPKDAMSWMALMRHYGLPSRLLDCTESFEIAAYFATTPSPTSDFAIWAIHRKSVQRAAGEALDILDSERHPLTPSELGSEKLFSGILEMPRRCVFLVDADHTTERQKRQKALFLCPGDLTRSFLQQLVAYSAIKEPESIYQIVLPPGASADIQADLKLQGVNRESLLPGPAEVDELTPRLGEEITKLQKKCGYLQWVTQIAPSLQRTGLLDPARLERR